jgi:pilus assembly protein Flp/PilA
MARRRRLRRGKRGQGIVEYALIIALIVIVIIGALAVLGPLLGSIFSQVPPAL